MRRFPDDFLFGCSTAAHQVEGNLDNDWTRMEREQPERIRGGDASGIACDHHRLYRSDLAMLAERHQNAYRFSIEWSRVEPRRGEFDRDELAHYADVARSCRRLGIEPVVTLQHFTLPTWVADRGGVVGADTPWLFARFAAACTEALGQHVRWWVTINEPTVLAVFGYLYGEWPPLQSSTTGFLAALRGMARMHAAAYHAVHEVSRRHGRSAMVSLAHHERPLHPYNPRSLRDRVATVLPNLLFNRWFLHACTTGRLTPPVGGGQRVPGLRRSMDYIGLNYYCNELVHFRLGSARSLFAENVADPTLPHSSFGWSIEPDGLRRALEDLWQRHHLPILVTENGVADEDDELRGGFLRDHVRAVGDAMATGVDVRGYLHWSSMDNFEWAEGYSKRFGLFAVDRETMARAAKPSASVYDEICRTRRVE